MGVKQGYDDIHNPKANRVLLVECNTMANAPLHLSLCIRKLTYLTRSPLELQSAMKQIT